MIIFTYKFLHRFTGPVVLLDRLAFKESPKTISSSKIVKIRKHYKTSKTSVSELAVNEARKGNEHLSCYDPHTCSICKRLFSSRYALRSHIDVVHGKTKKFFCDLCPKILYHKTHMHLHMRDVHSKKKFSCNICDFKTASKKNFLGHKMTHSEKVPCPICKKPVSSMKKHMINHKPRERCPTCNLIFSSRSLKQHMKIHNRIAIVHKCESCGEAFDNKEDLRR